jgi:ATP-binding protein involved in chromosome partitioning
MGDRDAKTQEILEALRAVKDPDLGRDVVSLGFVKDLTHCDGAVKATLELTTPACPAKERLQREAEAAVAALPWVRKVTIRMDAQVRPSAGAGASGGSLQGVKNVVAVASGKGGVGKSTIAVNLACGLARAGARSGLLDADLYGPSIPTMLGVRARPEAVTGEAGRRLFAPVEAHGVRLMSMGFLVEEDRPVIWRGPMLHGALKQFFGDVAWGDLDYLIVDLPPGTGDVALTMAQTIKMTGAIIVSTPQEVAMIDARKALNMFRETGISVLGIVENMSGEVFGEGGAAAWAEREKLRFLGSIPLDAAIRRSGDAGRPAVLDDASSAAGPLRAFVSAAAAAISTHNAEAPARKPLSIQR